MRSLKERLEHARVMRERRAAMNEREYQTYMKRKAAALSACLRRQKLSQDVVVRQDNSECASYAHCLTLAARRNVRTVCGECHMQATLGHSLTASAD